jgi:hypothetical protein
MVACEASGAREHGHDPKQEHQVEGPIMQAKEWTRAFGWCNYWSTRVQRSQRGDHRAEENRAREGHATTRAGRPALQKAPGVFCMQVALSFLHLCAQVFESRTTIDIAILLKLDSSITPLIHSKSTFRSNL